MRTVMTIGLVVGVAYLANPQATAEVVHSIMRGFEWGVGREIAHSLFGYRQWRGEQNCALLLAAAAQIDPLQASIASNGCRLTRNAA